MVAENRTWGAPRIHDELLKVGFGLPERTVLRWPVCSEEAGCKETIESFLEQPSGSDRCHGLLHRPDP
jgi:hypothetical protein